MDYGRLSLFMVGATATMAIATHLWCFAYTALSRAILYWRLDRLQKELVASYDAEEEAMDRRRAAASAYMTWEQAMADFRGGVPIDDVLDRLNGKFPPKAADIQHGVPPGEPFGISGQALAAVVCQVAFLTYFLGFVEPTPEMIEALLKNVKGGQPGKAGRGPDAQSGNCGFQGPCSS